MLVIVVVDRKEEAVSETVGKIDRILCDVPHTFACFQDYGSLIRKVEDRVFIPDIAVLTLDDSMEGIDAAGEVGRLVPDCEILFLADDGRHMTDVYAVPHGCLMLKEKTEEYLEDALTRAVRKIRERQEKNVQNSVFIKVHTKMIRFFIDEIIGLERTGRSSVIHTVNGNFITVEHPESIVARIENSRFLRCHQSYWVNTAHIFEGSAKELVTLDGSRFPVSRSYRAEMKRIGNGFFIQD